MKLAVVGSRSFMNRKIVYDEISNFYRFRAVHKENLTIVSGGAIGPDTFAEEWAIKNKISRLIFIPKWVLEGTYIASRARNKLIVDNCDALLCFWDGKSTGCMNAVEIAREQKKVIEIITKDQ